MKMLMTPKMSAVTTMVSGSGSPQREPGHDLDGDGQRDRVGGQAQQLLHVRIVQPALTGTMRLAPPRPPRDA